MWFRRHWLIGFPYGKGILTHNPSNQKNLGTRLISSIMKCCNQAWNQVLKLRKDSCVQKLGEFYAEKSGVVMTIQPSIIKKTSQVLHWMVGRPRLSCQMTDLWRDAKSGKMLISFWGRFFSTWAWYPNRCMILCTLYLVWIFVYIYHLLWCSSWMYLSGHWQQTKCPKLGSYFLNMFLLR